jgi:aspartate/methionine/tyrosine aminotransferase
MRAKRILGEIISVGSYSESKGIRFVRENICKYIAKMDGVDEPSKDQVILTEGA